MAHLSELTVVDRIFLLSWRVEHLFGRHRPIVVVDVDMNENHSIAGMSRHLECVICRTPMGDA